MNVLTSHAILQSVRDTAIRFADSDGGGKEWRAVLAEIINNLPQWSTILKSQLGESRGRRFAGDGGDVNYGTLQDVQGLRERDEHGNWHDVYEWFVERDPGSAAVRRVIRSRQCAWFIERLRILGFTSTRLGFLRDDSIESDFLVGGNALRGTREAFEQSEMTWSTLARFLQFVHEKSDWTTPLMPPYDSDECPFDDPESISNIREAQLSSYKNRINWCYRQILGGSGVIDTTGGERAYPVGVEIHELFNQEQGETLDFDLGDQPNADPPTEENKQPIVTVEDPIAKKKRQLAEILSILEEKAEKEDIREGDYKDYADLLMSFHRMRN